MVRTRIIDPMADLYSGESMPEHPPAESIAAYLSDTLSPQQVAALEVHLAGCRPCRLEVSSARRIIRSRAARNVWLLTATATAAAAAVLVAVLTRSPQVPSAPPDSLRTRGNVVEDIAPSLAALAPADGATVTRDALRFVWAGHDGRPLYHLTLTDPSGRAVWVRETSDTALKPEPEIGLDPGRSYYWYVDALDAGGTSLTTGPHRFTIVR
jgi:Putative zinc-finger